jgi:hypothetical protein
MKKIIGGVLIAAALAFGSGCARSDWISRTLVTVDVTGTWEGIGAPFTFNLKQEGPKVTGFVEVGGVWHDWSGPVTGTVVGDVLSFRQQTSSGPQLSGDMTVSGDEMTGTLALPTRGRQVFTLRRIRDPLQTR